MTRFWFYQSEMECELQLLRIKHVPSHHPNVVFVGLQDLLVEGCGIFDPRVEYGQI